MQVGESIVCELVANSNLSVLVEHLGEDDTSDENCCEQRSEDTYNKSGCETSNWTNTEISKNYTYKNSSDVGVEDCRISVLVTVCNSRLNHLAGSHFFADTLVDKYVSIHRHTYRKYHTCDTRESENSTKRCHNTEDEEEVANQSNVGNDTSLVVVENHVDKYEDESDDERVHTRVDSLLTK